MPANPRLFGGLFWNIWLSRSPLPTLIGGAILPLATSATMPTVQIDYEIAPTPQSLYVRTTPLPTVSGHQSPKSAGAPPRIRSQAWKLVQTHVKMALFSRKLRLRKP